jgi:predicted DNA-binding transcriptional regulator AlpA
MQVRALSPPLNGKQASKIGRIMARRRLLDEAEVAAALGVSVDTLRRLVEEGEFPDGIPVTDRNRKWVEKDIAAYLYMRSRVRKKPDPPAKPR